MSGMAAVMETRLLQAQSENMVPIDLISTLVSDELAYHTHPKENKLRVSHLPSSMTDIRRTARAYDAPTSLQIKWHLTGAVRSNEA
jgi:type II secretory pathway component GspD/PulD (secretin)